MLWKPLEILGIGFVRMAILFLLIRSPFPGFSQQEAALPTHIRARVLARQMSPYDAGILSDGATWQTLLVQLNDTPRGTKKKLLSLAIIRYEFFAPSEPGFPKNVNEYGPIWAFDGVRTVKCDETLKQLYYGGTNKSPDAEKSGNLLLVNPGAGKIVPKPSEIVLQCFLVHAGGFRQLAETP
jgi:hypothetical protein